MKNKPSILLATLLLILTSFGSVKALTNNGLATSVAGSQTGDVVISVIPLSGKVISGQSATLNYSIPDGAASAKLSLYCPDGVSSKGGTVITNSCNNTDSFPTIPESSKIFLTNAKDWPQYVVATLFVTFKTDPANPVQVSTQIAVLPPTAEGSSAPTDIADGSMGITASDSGILSQVMSGITSAFRSVVNGTTDILFPSLSSNPTVTLTVDGGHEHNYKVGESIKYSWSASNANDYSFVLTSNNPDKCGAGTWTPEQLSGTFNGTVYEIDNGCVWNITYKATNSSNGRTASDSVKLSVGNITPYTIIDTNTNNSFSGQNGSSQGNSNSGGSNSGSGFSSGGSSESSVNSSPSPSIRPISSPYKSPSPSPSRSASPSPSVTVKPSPSVSPSVSPRATYYPTPTVSSSPKPSSSVIANPTITPVNTNTPTPSVSATPSSSNFSTPTPSASPSPSSSPVSQFGQDSTATIFNAIVIVLKILGGL